MAYAERQEGRPAMRIARAAKELGVGWELLAGLVTGGQVEGFESVSPKGNRTISIYEDEVERLRTSMPSR